MVVAVQPTDAAAVAAGRVAVARRAGCRLQAGSVAAALRVAGTPVATAEQGVRFAVASQVQTAGAVGRQVAANVVVMLVRLEVVAEPGGYRLLGNHYPKCPK